MTTPLEQILRLGCSPEAAEVYEAVGRLCECRDGSQRLRLIAELEQAYRVCEAAHRDVEKEIDAFSKGDGTPADLHPSWKPD